MSSSPLSGAVVLLLAVACGLSVANVYYAQPLLDAMAETFAMDHATVGIIIALTQVGYGVGLLLLVPLGDLLNRRRLIVSQLLLSTLGSLLVHEQSNQQAVVGWDGLVYLENLSAHNTLQVTLGDGRTCQARFDIDEQQQGVPLIGPLVCQ
jgi:hypothetical protein